MNKIHKCEYPKCSHIPERRKFPSRFDNSVLEMWLCARHYRGIKHTMRMKYLGATEK